jgi:hypothetical protein
VSLADVRRDAESKLKADIAAIPKSDDAESYLPHFQTFGSTLFDAEAEEALDRFASEELYKSFMRDDLAPRLIEGIMPDQGLAALREKWSPEFSKLSTEKGTESEILLECRPDGTTVPAREEILAAEAPYGDFENFAVPAVRLSLRFPKNALIRESLRQVFERRIHYWIGRFRLRTGIAGGGREDHRDSKGLRLLGPDRLEVLIDPYEDGNVWRICNGSLKAIEDIRFEVVEVQSFDAEQAAFREGETELQHIGQRFENYDLVTNRKPPFL